MLYELLYHLICKVLKREGTKFLTDMVIE